MEIIRLVSYVLSVFIFLFLYWKRLREDYTSNIIFTSGFLLLIAIALGASASLLSPNFRSAFAFWGAVVGFAAGLGLTSKRYKMRFWESLEAAGVSLLFPLLVYCLWLLVTTTNAVAAIFVFLIISTLLLFTFLDSRYKSFTWYRSGRVGFAGLASLAIFFLIRSIIVVIAPASMVSFGGSIILGKFDVVLSCSVSFLLFAAIYWLSKSK